MLGVDRGGELWPAGPEGDLVAGVAQDHGEGGAPRARTHHRDPRGAHRVARLPGRCIQLGAAGRSASAAGPRPSSATSAVIASMIRSVASFRVAAVTGGARRSSSATGSPTISRNVLRGKSSRKSDPGAVHDLLRAPLPDRDHRAAGLQGDPGGAGLGRHRPQVRVAGDRALGVDDHGLADLDRVGLPQPARRPTAGRLALDRDLSAGPQDRPTTGTSKSDALARNRGQRPEKARNCPRASGSTLEMWLTTKITRRSAGLCPDLASPAWSAAA